MASGAATVTSASRAPVRKLESVQMLRGLAATLVFAGHLGGAAARELGHRPYAINGGAGVDVFFLISGFIMVYASEKLFGQPRARSDFFLRRLVRIVPLYWACSAVFLVLTLLDRNPVDPTPVGAIASFLFIPVDAFHRLGGPPFPVFDLGWTLNYEMMFYVLFTAAIVLRRNACVALVCCLLLAVVAVGAVSAPSGGPLFFWSRPIVLEFAAGMILATAVMGGRLRLHPVTRIACVVAGVAIYLLDPLHLSSFAITPNDFRRLGGWGLPAALLMVAAVSGAVPVRGAAQRVGVAIGDASYSLYLLHPFVIIVSVKAFLMVAHHVRLGPTLLAWLFVLATFAAAMVVALGVHMLVERPVTTRLVAMLRRRGAPIAAVPLTPPG